MLSQQTGLGTTAQDILVAGQGIAMNLHPARVLLGVGRTYLVETEQLPGRVIELVVVDLV